ncbi:hypothetical protein D8B26_007460 [Coccidioides posadasii str. Silveira]|uniref:uncharacterized protein n=1 Tax=Coccidioides posadasii (strain RMSCC 757 / Silveira) TaxID=443226 RepID=UPI001BEF611A|nr:hypothetical protein D8B26_007460 [Coccidioides posadasii str. Silveira]
MANANLKRGLLIRDISRQPSHLTLQYEIFKFPNPRKNQSCANLAVLRIQHQDKMKFLNALPLLLSSISPAAIAVPLADNFSKSCDILGVQQNTLTAICQAPRGEIRTSLDLNHCFANSDGQIVARNEYDSHFSSCSLLGDMGDS